jgi:hypothetical protein
MEMTRENHLDHLDYECLCLCRVHHLEKTDVHRIDAADTADSQREDQHAAEEVVEVAGSCIDWQPSRLFVMVRSDFQLKRSDDSSRP